PFPLDAQAVEPVVPVTAPDQREPMGARRQAPIDGADAVIVKSRRRGIGLGNTVSILDAGPQQGRSKGRSLLFEDRRVSRHPDIFRRRKGQPEKIVRAARTSAPTGGRMPPVLHVSLDE